MILITGGAGFLGSNLVASLNERGRDDIVIVDKLAEGQWKNLVKRRFSSLMVIPKAGDNLTVPDITAVIHLGAVTDTQAVDVEYILNRNYHCSVSLLVACQQQHIPFIYASSAAVYGDGSGGFVDTSDNYQPLNLYGWSKLLFDRHVRHQLTIPQKSQIVGLRFFNVYGPNEYHKGKMASVIAQQHIDLQAGMGGVFAGYPTRDFVYVEDAVNVILWMIYHPEVSGIFNVGTGQARIFEDFVKPLSDVWGSVKHIEMPASLAATYQMHTQADLTNLRKAGCDVPFRPIEEGVKHYVEHYLSQKDRYR